MGPFVRTLLIWLLVLAVPAQGAAAATMAFCGPNHHGGGSPGTEMAASTAEHAHHGDALAGHERGAVAAVGVVSTDEVSAIGQSGQVAEQTCSVCASCCTLGAILTTVPVVPATDLAPTVFITVVPTVDAFAADGPDRPPRHVRA